MDTSRSLDRRGFVAVGAVLAAGGLALPRSALAAALPSLGASPAATDPLDAIQAALDAPAVSWLGTENYSCQCARCQALRRQVWECTECGYEGHWLVAACECRELRASNIAFCQREIAAIDAGTLIVRPGDFTRDILVQHLAEDEARPDAMCVATADEATRERRREEGRQCGHGTMYCPTCANSGDGCPMDTPADLLARLREVRGVLMGLRTAGGAA